MTNKNKDEKSLDSYMPTSTVTQSRVTMWHGPASDVDTDGKLIRSFVTEGGKVVVKGAVLLNQNHRNILDTIFSFYQPTVTDKGLEFKFHWHDIQKNMEKKSKHNGNWYSERLDEMTQVLIRVLPNEKSTLARKYGTFSCGVIETHGKSVDDNDLYIVRLNSDFLEFFRNDTLMYYKALLPKIIKYRSHTVQAAIRLFLTHEQKNFKLSTLLHELGYRKDQMDANSWRNKRKAILSQAAKLEEDFGMRFHGDLTKRNADPTIMHFKSNVSGVYIKDHKTKDDIQRATEDELTEDWVGYNN